MVIHVHVLSLCEVDLVIKMMHVKLFSAMWISWCRFRPKQKRDDVGTVFFYWRTLSTSAYKGGDELFSRPKTIRSVSSLQIFPVAYHKDARFSFNITCSINASLMCLAECSKMNEMKALSTWMNTNSTTTISFIEMHQDCKILAPSKKDPLENNPWRKHGIGYETTTIKENHQGWYFRVWQISRWCSFFVNSSSKAVTKIHVFQTCVIY